MYYFDYHHHSNHSFDSQANMEDICLHAIKTGVKEICFTEHFSVNPKVPTYGHMNWVYYLKEINRCQEKFSNKLTIKIGIELCEPHLLQSEYKKALSEIPLDFILGSVHNIEQYTLRRFMNAFPEKDIYEAYFLELYEMIQTADIDVIAHFDLMKRYAHQTVGLYEFEKYKSIITDILKTAIKRGIGLEINTSGWRTNLNESLPSKDILSLYRKLGGEILTIGSDSHHAETVGAHFYDAVSLAKECGFTHIYTYEKRKPQAIQT
ncbi:histidinol-phosphatase HisJ family protein [Niallia sp. 01092]|uniref:histidinol-phosphatase HisJ family protein n=1 Tax=unclassified Niallia TaxID=2837522 RepID=UPI003FD0626F